MSQFGFTVLDIAAGVHAASPQLTARLRIEESTGTTVHAIALRCQVRIEPQRRGYDEVEQVNLRGIFGERERWSETLRPFQWMQCNATVQGFTGATEVDLALPCSYDLEITGSHYLSAVREGVVPIEMMFSGTVFTRGVSGFGVEQVPWDSDVRYDLPVAVWRDMIDHFFPNSGWIRLDRDVIDSLADYRSRHGLVSWEETLTRMLATDAVEGGVS